MKTKILTLSLLLLTYGAVLAQWQSNGSAVYYNNGNVGIGTTDPQQLLHVAGGNFNNGIKIEGDNTGLFIEDTGANPSEFKIYNNEGLGIWQENGTAGAGNRFFISQANGNIGIGTTNPQWGKLQINTPTEDDAALRLESGRFSMGGNARFEIDANGVVGGRFKVAENGNVGIGTANPNANLDVSGIAHFSGSASPSTPIEGAYIGWNGFPGTAGEMDFINHKGTGTGGFAFYNTDGNGSVKTLQMRIDGSGKVGIGTANPNANLDVSGIAHFSGSASPSTPIQGAYIGWNAFNGGTGETDFINHKGLGTGGFAFYNTEGDGSVKTLQMRIDGDGKVEIFGTAKATSFVSSAASFPDYVFAKDYKITPLSELEAYVTQHSRLPGMPSEKEVVEKGLNIPEVLTESVENIETIYLHLIHIEKELKALQQENARLKQKLDQGR